MKRLKALFGVTALCLATAGATAGMAHASYPTDPGGSCYWISSGSNSNCDGFDQGQISYCDTATSADHEIDRYLGDYVTLKLIYRYGPGGTCRTVHGELAVGTHLNAGYNCYLFVQRNSDGKKYYGDWQSVGDSDAYISTPMVYDAGVSSYVWAYCSNPGVGTVSGGTSAY